MWRPDLGLVRQAAAGESAAAGLGGRPQGEVLSVTGRLRGCRAYADARDDVVLQDVLRAAAVPLVVRRRLV